MTTTPQDNGPADAASENSATSNSPPRRRLRKRWIILATLCALVVTSVWLILRDEPLAVMKLPDGRTFTIHKLTYGREHSYHAPPAALTPVEVWLNRQLTRFGRQISQSSSGGQFLTGGNTTSVAVWHSFDWSKPANESTPKWMVVTDENGWRTAVSTQHLQSAPPPATIAGQPSVPHWLSCGMPSASRSLQVELLDAKNNVLTSTRIAYDVPKTLLESWASPPPSLPVTEADGNLTATITALHATWSSWPAASQYDLLNVVPELVVEVDGKPSISWAPMTQGVPFFEYWNNTPIVATIRSPYGNGSPMAQCGVSPYESAWKLHLPVICHNPDEVAASDRVHLGQIQFATKQPNIGDAREATAIGKSMARLLGAARAGVFSYEGEGEGNFPIPAPQPIEWWTGNSLKGTFQTTSVNVGGYSSYSYASAAPGKIVRSPQQPLTVQLKFTAPRPHVLISLTETGERFPLVIVKDANGRVLEGELFNAQGLLVWLAKEAYDDVEQVDVTLLLQKPRVFTFVVPPPKMPPRPVAAAK